jgi:peptidoglycan biosynthesis protein MviN/MurJ (putative lipid II flippase)
MLEALLLVPVAVTTVATEAILYVTGDTRGPFWATAVGIVAATSCVPLLIATRSPFALAFGAVVSEIAVAAFLLVRHQRSRAKRTGPKPVRGT